MRIDVYLKHSKNESKVIKIDFAKYEVWVKSPPFKGRANKELIEVLANYFNVKSYNLRIAKGLTNPNKTLELTK